MKRLFSFAKKSIPSISQTERIALESGTVGIEKYVFKGNFCYDKLSSYKTHDLTNIDKKIISRIPKLINVVNEYDVLKKRKTPKDHPFWNIAKKEGFFSLIVPEEYGGEKMSSTGLSSLLQNLSSVSASIPVHVMVPNSLGPSELLAHYGTEEQKKYYLPKLAKGFIPCFGLTSLHAGSDAAGSMTDTGTVFLENNTPKISLNCEKRYITLAPVADIIGIAFKIIDTDDILKKVCGRSVHNEITLALIDRDHKDLEIGDYLDPLGVGFANGTINAKNVVIDIENVIGGISGLGNGWKFLMEALAAGRGTALPAGAAGSSKMLTNAVSGYTTVRKQFKIPINKFEGIQEKLADMAMRTYEIDSLVGIMNSVLDNNERPPILSAILKQRTTELGRDVVNHAMDICAGAAICMGDNNFVAPAYLSCPIGITVEGSNTMTRSLLIFGQGIVRSHPHMLSLMNAIENDKQKEFNNIVFSMVRENINLVATPVVFKSDLERFVKFFALSANMSLVLGGELKRREFLSGRYADMLSYIIAGFAMEWHFKNNKLGNSIILQVCQQNNLNRLETCANELIENHPHTFFHKLAYKRFIGSKTFSKPSDLDKARLTEELCTYDSELRNLFEMNNYSRVHPNIKRINEFMKGENTSDDIVDKILSVDIMEKHVTDLLK